MSIRRVLAIGVPTTAALLTGGAYYRDDLKAFASILDPNSQPSQFSPHSSYNSSGYFSDSYQPSRWNSNWDNRDPMSMIDPVKFNKASDEEKKEMLEKVKPKATRHIFLIRHGQYHLDSEKKNLTDLGREQAIYLGKRFTKSDLKFDKMTMSTMNRATETAMLMLEQMDKNIKHSSDSIIEEGAPFPPEPPSPHWRPKQKVFFTDGSRIEAAFRKYIHRASPKQKEDSFEVIVCHGNVIRYFVCRALQFPPEGWLRLAIGHTSVTWLSIRPNGNVTLRSYGDIGHLPPEKVSFS